MVKCPPVSVGEAWSSIEELGKKRPGVENLIVTPHARANFLQSPARKTWDELLARPDHLIMPGEVTRSARVRAEGQKQDLVARTIPLNLIRSLFLRYWLYEQAPEIYHRCKQVLNGNMQVGPASTRQELKNAGLWEESESYALSNVTLQMAAKRKTFRDRIIRTLPSDIEIPLGMSPESYEFVREMVAGRVRSGLQQKKGKKKDPLIVSVVEWLEQHGSRPVDGVGALERGLVKNSKGQPTSPQDVLNLAVRQLQNMLTSGVRTCYNNASQINEEAFPKSEGKGVGPSSSAIS